MSKVMIKTAKLAKNALKSTKKAPKMTFFKNPKKFFFPPQKGSYMLNLDP